MSRLIKTPRLVLRPWKGTDVEDAAAVYTAPAVTRWLTPHFGAVDTPERVRIALSQWQDEACVDPGHEGHWAVLRSDTTDVVGGLSLQYVPTGGESLTIAWALAPDAWGRGYATEAGDALIRWAMHEEGAIEVFAIVQPDNDRAARTAKSIGMEWVTEIGDLINGRYAVYRIRHGDLDYED